MTSPLLSGSVIRSGDFAQAVHAFDITTQTNILDADGVHSGSPEVSVSFVAPRSGRVLSIVGGGVRDNTNEASIRLMVEIREDDVNGAVVENAAVSVNGWSSSGLVTDSYQYGSGVTVAPMDNDGPTTALEPGRTYFARVMQEGDTGDTGDIFNRDLTIVPLPLGQVYSAVPLGLDTIIKAGQDFRTQFNVDATPASPDFGDPEFGLFFRGPSSGRALIVVGGGIRDNGAGGGRLRMCPEVRLDDVNGELLLDPGDQGGTTAFATHGWSNSAFETSNYQYGSRVGFLGSPATDPLIPGQQYFARIAMENTGSADVFNRDLFVIGVA